MNSLVLLGSDLFFDGDSLAAQSGARNLHGFIFSTLRTSFLWDSPFGSFSTRCTPRWRLLLLATGPSTS